MKYIKSYSLFENYLNKLVDSLKSTNFEFIKFIKDEYVIHFTENIDGIIKSKFKLK